ncbi:MAG TPA: hypothetical protein VGL35_13640 [Rhizomicrobium sp.]|jgi:hypothetical protein
MGASAGLYFFPWTDMKGKNATAEQTAKMTTNPSGLLIYRPPGAADMTAETLGIELAKEIVISILAAFLLSRTVLPGYWARAGSVTLIGVIATLTTNASSGVLKRKPAWRPMAVATA